MVVMIIINAIETTIRQLGPEKVFYFFFTAAVNGFNLVEVEKVSAGTCATLHAQFKVGAVESLSEMDN